LSIINERRAMAENYDERLAGYVEVHTRISEFIEKYPEGSLQGQYEITEIGDQLLIIYTALAYRNPEDERPGVGMASEPVPGLTPYTKNSELMNAETSAWGRALAAIGIRVHDSVASANEVRARRTDDEQQTGFASEKQEKYLRRLIGTDADQNLIVGYLEANHHGGRDGGISRAIDKLKEDETRADTLLRLEALATEWDKQQPATETVVPDDEDLPQLDDIARD
jgi:hypothetical protein